MSRRLRSESGFTLVELLIVMVLMIGILSATLTLSSSFERGTRDNERLNEQLEIARNTADKASRQLRNLAKPSSGAPGTIALADEYDLIFQTSDPSRTWVRYCLRTVGGGASADNAQLWSAESDSAALPSGANGSCPGNNWPSPPRIVASHVVNTSGPQDRPVFAYGCTAGASPDCGTSTPAAAAEYPRIKSVSINVFVDLNVARRPLAEPVSTTVFLRNQNEAPTASFSWRPLNPGKVFLNGSASADPEGRTLRYYWFDGAVPAFTCDTGPPDVPAYLKGVTVTYSGAPSSTPSITLVVCDPGDLKNAVAETQTVTVP